MNEPKSDARYTMGRTQGEEDRLIQQSQLYDAVTRRFLWEAGLGSGMKVLDIGSGPGDVALTAAGLVGEAGSVVGVDVNPAILETARARAQQAGLANVEFVAGDARTLDLGSDFDALVGRLVLMYMADPAEVLKQLATRVRPGGIVAFQEVDFTPYRQMYRPDTPVANKLIDWALGVFERSGAHVAMGFDLYHTFVKAGLPEPYMHFGVSGRRPGGLGRVFIHRQRLPQPAAAPGGVRDRDCGGGRGGYPGRAGAAGGGDLETSAAPAPSCHRLGPASSLILRRSVAGPDSRCRP